MELRPYQQEAYDAVHAEFERVKRTCVVLPTGTGKTPLFAAVARDWSAGRVMVTAPMDELVGQAARKLYQVTGEFPAIEQADQFANEGSVYGRSQFIVASAQSLHGKRLTPERFNEIGLLIIDEAHRASESSKTYGRIVNTLTEKNPHLRILGVTATPNRLDGRKLLFDSFAYTYGLKRAIDDAYLVGIRSSSVVIENLDFSQVRKLRNDLDQQQLAEVFEKEGPLHEIASTVHRHAAGRKTLTFCASVKQAEELCAVLNRYSPGRAAWICGDQNAFPRHVRREILQRFHEGEYQYLLTCNCLTEGYDEPGIELIVMARPTQSTSLAIQMLGRGTRPLDGLLQPGMNREERWAAIQSSHKPHVEVLDFVDVSSTHKFVTAADASILGGDAPLEVIVRAKENIERAGRRGQSCDVLQELQLAGEEIGREREAANRKQAEEDRKREERRSKAEARRLREAEERAAREAERKEIVGQAEYRLISVDPFDVNDAAPARRTLPTSDLTPKQRQVLLDYGIRPDYITRRKFSGIMAGIKSGKIRRKPRIVEGAEASSVPARTAHATSSTAVLERPAAGGTAACTERQRTVLARFGLPTNVSFAEAARLISVEVNGKLAKRRSG